jgi:hypothetical protein
MSASQSGNGGGDERLTVGASRPCIAYVFGFANVRVPCSASPQHHTTPPYLNPTQPPHRAVRTAAMAVLGKCYAQLGPGLINFLEGVKPAQMNALEEVFAANPQTRVAPTRFARGDIGGQLAAADARGGASGEGGGDGDEGMEGERGGNLVGREGGRWAWAAAWAAPDTSAARGPSPCLQRTPHLLETFV